MAVFVGHHVLLGQRATAGTELVPEHIEESDIEVGGPIARAVERADVTGRRTAGGLDLILKYLHPRPLITRKQLLPHRVHRVTRRDHPALHDGVRILAGLALAGIKSGRRDAAGVVLLRRHDSARIDPEKERDDKNEETADAAPDCDAASRPAAATTGGRGACVDLHAFVEGHRAPTFSI